MPQAKIGLLEPLTRLVPLAPSPLRVLMVLPEAYPYASVGGVSRVGAHLAKALVKLGHDVRLFMPKYGMVDEERFPMEMVVEGLKVYTDADGSAGSPQGERGPKELVCNVKTHLSEDGVRTYFLENMEYYEQRANVYGYNDDPVRFALLCRGAFEFLRHFEWKPQVIHAHDWHTGAVPNFLKTTYAKSPDLRGIASVFTIHNLYYQGMFDHRQVSELDIDDGKSPIASLFSDRLKKQNFMRRGILYADLVNTVSETYAREILTPEYGEGLDKLLMEVRTKLFGVVNGIDYEDYNPATDPLVPFNYDLDHLSKRAKNKEALQKEFNLPVSDKSFLLAMVSRLTEQKGLEILLEALPPFLKEYDAQFVIVGGGEERYAEAIRKLQKEFPQKVGMHLLPNFTLPRLIFAGADAVAVPSRFEPAGLVQLEAMRYGSVPIVRQTGGLADTVTDFDPEKEEGTGFVFRGYDRWALHGALVRSYGAFRYPRVWGKLVERAMRADFSWGASAAKYAELYRKAILFKERTTSRKRIPSSLEE